MAAGTSRPAWVVEMCELLRRDDLQMALQTPTSIFKLPDSVTKNNPQAYSPSRLFLGPFHELRPELHKMEILKLEIARRVKEKFQLPEFDEMVDQLRELDVQIRACYDGNLAIGSEALAWRILIDGLFFIWLLGISHDHKEDKGKVPALNLYFRIKMPVFDEQRLFVSLEGDITTMTQNEIVKDLLKLENQIPIQFLKRVLPKNVVDQNLHNLFYKFCKSVSPLSLPPYDNADFVAAHCGGLPNLSETLDQSQHLLHFLYALLFFQRFLAYSYGGEERDADRPVAVEVLNLTAKILRLGFIQQLVDAVGLIKTLIGLLGRIHKSSIAIDTSPKFPSASELKKVGVKFHGGGRKDGRFKKKPAALTLPTIAINDFCEVILRNLVAFEVEAKINPASLSDYVKLMSGLIATANDVKILRKGGIIAGGRSGDEDDVVKLFKELGNDVVKVSSFDDGQSTTDFYSCFKFEVDIIEEISKYYESRWVVKAERFGKKYICPVIQALLILVVVVLILIVAVRTVCGWFSCPKIMGHNIINTSYYFFG